MIITIDGPVASGKSTIAKLVAKHFSYYYINSGLLFRSIAYLLKNYCEYTEENLKNIDKKDVQFLLNLNRFRYVCDKNSDITIFFRNQNIMKFLKSAEIDNYSSIISKQQVVRNACIIMQKELGKKYNLVVDGRDAGSIVFPNADYKFFVTASENIRAERWQKDKKKRGELFNLKESVKLISQRDKQDCLRKIAPLIIPQKALVIDTSDLTIEGSVEKIINIIKKKRH